MALFINTSHPLVLLQSARKRPRSRSTTCSLIINRRELANYALATAIAIPRALFAEPTHDNNDVDAVQKYQKLPSGLVVQDLRVGDGASPLPGSSVRVRWTGRLIDRYGWNFQKEPLEAVYVLDEKDPNLIAGFREGVLGMKLHGKRRLFIPTKLGYRTAKELPQPSDFGDKRRLETSVANKRRTIVDGQGDGGDVLIDVELVRILPLKS